MYCCILHEITSSLGLSSLRQVAYHLNTLSETPDSWFSLITVFFLMISVVTLVKALQVHRFLIRSWRIGFGQEVSTIVRRMAECFGLRSALVLRLRSLSEFEADTFRDFHFARGSNTCWLTYRLIRWQWFSTFTWSSQSHWSDRSAYKRCC